MRNLAQSDQSAPTDTHTLRARCVDLFKRTQQRSCSQLEVVDQKAHFTSDVWTRTDTSTEDGGGGLSRVLRGGGVFEQAGVNFSEVSGILPADMAGRLNLPACDTEFFATGISMVIHPNSPMIPTTHANFRLIEAGSKCWFGGGMDLTPYYLFEEDCVHFHTVLKDICDRHDQSFYPQYKKKCDEYFYLPHRKESRGIGGVFFDYLGMNEPIKLESFYTFVEDMCDNFMQSYLPIASRRKDLSWNDHQKSFQLLRRGRYVEFNLLYDRGTLFGLKTGGRTESILMSLPPEVRWEYCDKFPLGDEENKLLSTVKNPREWVK